MSTHNTNTIVVPIHRHWHQKLAAKQQIATPALPMTGKVMLDAFLAEPMAEGPFHNIAAVLRPIGQAVEVEVQEEEVAVTTAATYGGSDASVEVGTDNVPANMEHSPPRLIGDSRQRDLDLLEAGAGMPLVAVGDLEAFLQDIEAVLA